MQLAREPGDVEGGHLTVYRIDTEGFDPAADIDCAVVHGVAQVLAGIAENDHAAALHHEAAKGAGAPAHDDGTAFHVDADARACVPHADEIAAAQTGTQGRSRRSSR